jgi:hypothetical protein
MSAAIIDLYTDYLISSTQSTTATGLSRLLEGSISHDQVTRFLSGKEFSSMDLWHVVKPLVREIEGRDGVLIVDDSIEEKPYTDENEIVCWHYDHSKGHSVKGINFVTALYQRGDMALPVAYELVRKNEVVVDPKTGKEKRKSSITKNEQCRRMLKACVQNKLQIEYVLADTWYASAETMSYIREDLSKGESDIHFVMPLKSNRKVALSLADKKAGKWRKIGTLSLEKNAPVEVWLEGVDFPLLLCKQVFTNEDGGSGVLYLVSSDMNLTRERMINLYQRRWKVEEYHKSLKQNASLEKSPTRTVTTQTNHLFASLVAYTKLEKLKVQTKCNHFALKSKIYISALQVAYQELREIQKLYGVTSVTA